MDRDEIRCTALLSAEIQELEQPVLIFVVGREGSGSPKGDSGIDLFYGCIGVLVQMVKNVVMAESKQEIG
ncbi:hypothetical protein D3C73_1060980 [compost metagenome]